MGWAMAALSPARLRARRSEASGPSNARANRCLTEGLTATASASTVTRAATPKMDVSAFDVPKIQRTESARISATNAALACGNKMTATSAHKVTAAAHLFEKKPPTAPPAASVQSAAETLANLRR